MYTIEHYSTIKQTNKTEGGGEIVTRSNMDVPEGHYAQ